METRHSLRKGSLVKEISNNKKKPFARVLVDRRYKRMRREMKKQLGNTANETTRQKMEETGMQQTANLHGNVY